MTRDRGLIASRVDKRFFLDTQHSDSLWGPLPIDPHKKQNKRDLLMIL